MECLSPTATGVDTGVDTLVGFLSGEVPDSLVRDGVIIPELDLQYRMVICVWTGTKGTLSGGRLPYSTRTSDLSLVFNHVTLHQD